VLLKLIISGGRVITLHTREQNSRNQGWQLGTENYSDTEAPWNNNGINFPYDPYHLAMEVVAIVHFCKNGNMHALPIVSGAHELSWTWNKKTKSWVGPNYDKR